jgi:DNA polymerase
MGPKDIGALPFLPARVSMTSLREAAQRCQGCPLYRHATQTVFGTGKLTARVFMVGEEPGHDEDLAGQPFVGPAGRVLDQALEAAGIARGDTYITNAVKHFKWIPRGKRRLHQRPTLQEIAACRPWLEKELELVRPQVLVCLGATAARTLLGRDFKVTLRRGQATSTPLASHAVATVHPSFILRQQTEPDRRREMDRFVADLTVAARLLDARGPEASRHAVRP